MSLGPRINDAILGLVTLEHRVDPYFRDGFNALLQHPLVNMVQFFLRLLHKNPETALCQEIVEPDEQQIAAAITEKMKEFTALEYQGRTAERAGNTKTYGVVRAEFQVLEEVLPIVRKGVFAEAKTYPAWIRFSGPGPLSPPDVADAGILSIGIKVMGVAGDKLLGDEKWTQDFLGISCPTFTTPNTKENLKLQGEIYARTPVFYFFKPFDSHLLDAAMQGLYARMNRSPLEVQYWSCVPYLCGDGLAVKYSVRPASDHKTKIPWNPPDNWLRQSLAMRLANEDVELDFLIQAQTDPRRMPIEDASIEWPERLSPFVPVAKIRIPRQRFDSPEQLDFANVLSYNPWHTSATHRPLGNQNRARKLIYTQLSEMRQAMNHAPHIEPDGSETFQQ
ncbi:catalase family protein [Alloacidobacterium sp.]|uniref:catalase family protein n=1 Tax=Alloacidobacterium sp. TaxID=2951999 RepID=UPI002D43AE34|nr:catalase family protein [Alloacidobacterium sp.]HYK37399.1 catalase family protein [Alloacidobacterium sp.]